MVYDLIPSNISGIVSGAISVASQLHFHAILLFFALLRFTLGLFFLHHFSENKELQGKRNNLDVDQINPQQKFCKTGIKSFAPYPHQSVP